MGYYHGAAGDYYRGDFFSGLVSTVKSFAAPILSAVGNAIAPGVGGVIGGIAGGAIQGAGAAAPAQAGMTLPSLPAVGGAIARVARSPTARNIAVSVGTGLAVDALGRVIAGHGGKKRRSMNVTNVHALRRSLRRVEGFKHLAKKVGACPPPRRHATQRSACCK